MWAVPLGPYLGPVFWGPHVRYIYYWQWGPHSLGMPGAYWAYYGALVVYGAYCGGTVGILLAYCPLVWGQGHIGHTMGTLWTYCRDTVSTCGKLLHNEGILNILASYIWQGSKLIFAQFALVLLTENFMMLAFSLHNIL